MENQQSNEQNKNNAKFTDNNLQNNSHLNKNDNHMANNKWGNSKFKNYENNKFKNEHQNKNCNCGENHGQNKNSNMNNGNCNCGENHGQNKNCNCGDNQGQNNHGNCNCGENKNHCENGEDNLKSNCDGGANNAINKEQEYLEMAQRMKADFDNYKKRTESVVSNSYTNGVANAVAKLLPALDSFKQAIDKITDESSLVGVNLIYSQIIKALNELGVKKIDCVGKQFNPNFHNAVLTDNNNDLLDNVIIEEYQEGFTISDKVIRHSVVKINKVN